MIYLLKADGRHTKHLEQQKTSGISNNILNGNFLVSRTTKSLASSVSDQAGDWSEVSTDRNRPT